MKLTRKHEVKKKQEMSEFKSSPQTLFLEYKKVQIKIPIYTHIQFKIIKHCPHKIKKQTSQANKEVMLGQECVCPITSI